MNNTTIIDIALIQLKLEPLTVKEINKLLNWYRENENYMCPFIEIVLTYNLRGFIKTIFPIIEREIPSEFKAKES